jgi:predicted glycosyl hydrolase (DUF1957 family)
MSIFQLKTVSADDGVVMTIRHPESSLPMDGQTITLLGTDSRVYREHIAKRERAMIEHVNATHKPPKLVHEQTKQRALDDLVLLTIGWTLDGIDGNPVEFTKEAARDLYADAGMAWLREQAEAFVQDRSNFLRK